MSIDAMTYFDYAAATPLDPAVLEAMQPYFSVDFFNPSSPYAPAIKVRRDLESARQRLAVCFGANAAGITLTAGATESIALAMTAAAGGNVVTSTIEHPAVLENAKRYDARLVKSTATGRIEPEGVRQAITAETQVVSIGLANSELGTIQPLSKIAEVVKAERLRRQLAGDKRPIWLHSDASQGTGLLDIHISRLGVDLLTLNAAKVYGPKQVGLLWRQSNVTLQPIVEGGGQESGLRSGTESVANAVGFAVALERAEKRRKSEARRLQELRDLLQYELASAFDEAVISGDQKRRLPSHLHIAFDGLDAERLIFLLESKGVLVATGSACAANKDTRSHVLEAIGMADSVADGSLRLTLGAQTTQADIEKGAAEIITAIKQEKARLAR